MSMRAIRVSLVMLALMNIAWVCVIWLVMENAPAFERHLTGLNIAAALYSCVTLYRLRGR